MSAGAKLGRLGLPLAEPSVAWLLSIFVLVFYGLTTSWDIGFYDSGEIALVSYQLGLGHPVGQPLHTVIGALVSHLPFWPPTVGLTLLSAVPFALTTFPVLSLSETSLFPSSIGPTLAARRRAYALAGLAPLAALLHYCAWEPATRIEVYGLAVFLSLWGLAKVAATPTRPAVGAGALGLAVATHAVVGASLAVVAFAMVAFAPTAEDAARKPRLLRLLKLGGGFTAGAATYLYVPLVAHRGHETLLWGAPRTLEALIDYLSGADYAHNQSIELSSFVDHTERLATFSTAQGLVVFWGLGLATSLYLTRRHRMRRGALLAATQVIPLALLYSFVAANVHFHPDVTDYLGYLAAPLLLSTVPVAAMFIASAPSGAAPKASSKGEAHEPETDDHDQRPPRPPGTSRAVRVMALCCLMGAAVLSPKSLWAERVFSRQRASDDGARRIAAAALDEAPPRAIVIVQSDPWVGPLLYLQEAEGLRPDVVLVPYGLTASSWYFDHLDARHDLAPFERRGPGGRDARLRRFIAAQGDRPVLVENEELVVRLGRPACAVGMLIVTGEGSVEGVRCPRSLPSPRTATETLERLMLTVGVGSPPTHEVLSMISLKRGVVLWRMGQPDAAEDALWAGVSPGSRPTHIPVIPLEGAPPFSADLPDWHRPAAIADETRNIFVLSELYRAANQDAIADALRELAQDRGLPEATPD